MGDPFVRPGLTYQPHIEQVLLRNEGTLTLESSKDDWLKYQHRDTLASIILHRDRLEYLSVVENAAPARMERILLERAVDPIRKRDRSST
ncbi:Splicing factor 3B subunit 5/RDS3 complex subunit 10 [Trypanosoma melophagium]|uniref:Splicing factor 3B subunit 5/RDS3 complex subunit 10 n=1 Tax=Trypanosoma melophagium TaxID=715481 RepID=UPI003519DE70|nr:Splicing factor 3B subunit 5/RDS3 complex subunit 10 [Trypanosoma melophagium]